MNKLTLLNEEFIKARKEKNAIASALFSTFRGEYDTAIKNGKPEGNDTIEKIAKKMNENAKLINNDEAKIEMELLKPFLPEMMNEEQVRLVVLEVVNLNPDKANNYKLGSKGAITGMIMKQIAGKADASMVNKIIEETIQ